MSLLPIEESLATDDHENWRATITAARSQDKSTWVVPFAALWHLFTFVAAPVVVLPLVRLLGLTVALTFRTVFLA
jgi:hypothetical protein